MFLSHLLNENDSSGPSAEGVPLSVMITFLVCWKCPGIGFASRSRRRVRCAKANKKADAVEGPEAFHDVGLLGDRSPGSTELPFNLSCGVIVYFHLSARR